MSSAAARRKLLMPHEERLALIRRPFPITYIPPVKRWGGVQLGQDDQWDEATERYHLRRRYADRFELEEGA